MDNLTKSMPKERLSESFRQCKNILSFNSSYKLNEYSECNENCILDYSKCIDIHHAHLSSYEAEVLTYPCKDHMVTDFWKLFGFKFEASEICKDDFVASCDKKLCTKI